jgi:hypothetical protein
MLEITIPSTEYYDDRSNCFIETREQKLRLEHSLVSLSKWESKWHKPFLSTSKNQTHTYEETIDYIRCMTITQNVDYNAYYALDNKAFKQIEDYIANPMTATWFRDKKGSPNRRVITSEVIYYWMIELDIPFECEKWHLNRLMTLIRVCNEENSGGKKMSPKDLKRQNSALNAARKKKYNTRG